MVTEEEMIDQIVIAESKEDFAKSAKILGEIAKAYGYQCEMTGDGNWILTNEKYRIEAMFDSSRGGDIPIDIAMGDEILDTKWVNPDQPREIVLVCIEFMKEHQKEATLI
jgi:hypothetical protein